MELNEQIEIVKELLEGVKELNGEHQEGWDEDIAKGENLLEYLKSAQADKPQVQELDLANVSESFSELLNNQKSCYKERKERSGKATAYKEAYEDEIREGVIDHLIAVLNSH